MSGEPDREQIATVLDRIAEHSSGDDIREHIRQVSRALRGTGLIFINGPPSQGEAESGQQPRAAGGSGG